MNHDSTDYYSPSIFPNSVEHGPDDWSNVHNHSSHPFSHISIFDHNGSFLDPFDAAMAPMPMVSDTGDYVHMSNLSQPPIVHNEPVTSTLHPSPFDNCEQPGDIPPAVCPPQVPAQVPGHESALVPTARKSKKRNRQYQDTEPRYRPSCHASDGANPRAFSPIRVRTGLPGNTAVLVDPEDQKHMFNTRSPRRDSGLLLTDASTSAFVNRIHHDETSSLISKKRRTAPLSVSVYNEESAQPLIHLPLSHSTHGRTSLLVDILDPLPSQLTPLSPGNNSHHHSSTVNDQDAACLSSELFQSITAGLINLENPRRGFFPTQTAGNRQEQSQLTSESSDSSTGGRGIAHDRPTGSNPFADSRSNMRTQQLSSALGGTQPRRLLQECRHDFVGRPRNQINSRYSIFQHPNVLAEDAPSPSFHSDELIRTQDTSYSSSVVSDRNNGFSPSSTSSQTTTRRSRRPSRAGKERKFVCEQCNEAFKRGEHLKRHMRIHTGERPFVCPEPDCDKQFSRTDNLAQHMKVHEKHAKGHQATRPSFLMPPPRKTRRARNAEVFKWVPVYQDEAGQLVAGMPQSRPRPSSSQPRRDSGCGIAYGHVANQCLPELSRSRGPQNGHYYHDPEPFGDNSNLGRCPENGHHYHDPEAVGDNGTLDQGHENGHYHHDPEPVGDNSTLDRATPGDNVPDGPSNVNLQPSLSLLPSPNNQHVSPTLPVNLIPPSPHMDSTSIHSDSSPLVVNGPKHCSPWDRPEHSSQQDRTEYRGRQNRPEYSSQQDRTEHRQDRPGYRSRPELSTWYEDPFPGYYPASRHGCPMYPNEMRMMPSHWDRRTSLSSRRGDPIHLDVQPERASWRRPYHGPHGYFEHVARVAPPNYPYYAWPPCCYPPLCSHMHPHQFRQRQCHPCPEVYGSSSPSFRSYRPRDEGPAR